MSVHLGFSFVFIVSYSSGWIIIIPEGHPIAHVNIDSTCSHTLEWNLKKLIEAELNHQLGSDRRDRRDRRNRRCSCCFRDTLLFSCSDKNTKSAARKVKRSCARANICPY